MQGCSHEGVERAGGAREGGVTQRSESCWTGAQGPSFAPKLLEALPPLLTGAHVAWCPCWCELQKGGVKMMSPCLSISFNYFLLLT